MNNRAQVRCFFQNTRTSHLAAIIFSRASPCSPRSPPRSRRAARRRPLGRARRLREARHLSRPRIARASGYTPPLSSHPRLVCRVLAKDPRARCRTRSPHPRCSQRTQHDAVWRVGHHRYRGGRTASGTYEKLGEMKPMNWRRIRP